MPKKSLRCHVEIDIHSVTSPGTWLVKRDDLYVSVTLFGQVRRTCCVSAIFPLIFHEKFKFDKVFYTAYEPSQVADSLECLNVRIELIQLSDLYEDGRLLAWYESSARNFLYPYPSYSPSYGTHDREVLMDRTMSFPGISPRLEFSTKTVIQQTITPLLEPWDLDEEVATYTGSSARRSRSRTRSKSPALDRRSRSFNRPTISSISRSRSVSPALVNRTNSIALEDSESSAVEDKPPFVVRKVGQDLIGRKPGTILKRSLSVDRKRSSSVNSGRHSDYLNKSYDYSTTCNRPRHSTYASSYDYAVRDPLLDSPFYRELRARALSPWRYYYTYRDIYGDPSWGLTRAELIRDRVERALRRDRSLERLELLRGYRPYLHDRSMTGLW